MTAYLIEDSYKIAKKKYAKLGVDSDHALEKLNQISLSIPCWQGDDVGGFEHPNSELSGGGIMATGNYPGKANNIIELQKDLTKAVLFLLTK